MHVTPRVEPVSDQVEKAQTKGVNNANSTTQSAACNGSVLSLPSLKTKNRAAATPLPVTPLLVTACLHKAGTDRGRSGDNGDLPMHL